ncbi:MAG: hypothetical protein LUG83_05130 [Lachnospiraceae bacterium]|nr:hypothetical protein [Lachnospiraceae bacterium]
MGTAMKFSSAFYRQCGGRTAILLQQVVRKKDSCGILLACVCTSEKMENKGRPELCDRLLCMFREELLTGNACGAAEYSNNIEKLLRAEADEYRRGFSKCSYSGILCIGDEALLFAAGRQRIYLINSAFMRPQISLIMGEGDFLTPRILRAGLEQGVSVLLGTEPFFEYMDEGLIKECLFIRGDMDGIRTERHLREYGRYMEDKGGTDMGAAVVRAL